MKSSDRAILVGILIVGLLAAFWFMVLSPKRSQVSDLDAEISKLEQQIASQEELVAYAQASKADYDSNYRELVVLGKAVPSGEDTSSLFLQVNELAEQSGVRFDAITLNENAAAAEPTAAAAQTTADAPATPEAPAAPEGGSTEAAGDSASTPVSAATPATPTEASAAALPIGATVGPAGLPVMPYTIKLTGNFFQIADFLAKLDSMVGANHGRQVVDGRLTTIDGFSLVGDKEQGFPTLNASLAITTYVTPADQGATAGATPTAPAPSTAPATVPTSTPTP